MWRHQDAGGDIKTSERKRELKGCLCFLGGAIHNSSPCLREENTAFCFWNTSRGPPSLEQHITGKWARGQRTFLGDLQTSSVCVWDIIVIIINNNNSDFPLDLAGHQNQTDERGLSTSLLENEIFYSHMCRQNPGSRYLVSHVHNKFGTEDNYQFITPLTGGGNLKSAGFIGPFYVFSNFLVHFKHFSLKIGSFFVFLNDFKKSTTYPPAKMRRLTLKLRAQMVLFIMCTCIICQCGLIKGESEYYFIFYWLLITYNFTWVWSVCSREMTPS